MSKETLEVVMDELELTAVMLAKRLDVNPKTVGRWLNGDIDVPGSVALLLSVAHEMLKFSHVWAGNGIAAQSVPTKRVQARK